MNYKIVDDTECEVLYFDNTAQVSKYVKNHKNHLMTSYVSCAGKWQEIAYYGGKR